MGIVVCIVVAPEIGSFMNEESRHDCRALRQRVYVILAANCRSLIVNLLLMVCPLVLWYHFLDLLRELVTLLWKRKRNPYNHINHQSVTLVSISNCVFTLFTLSVAKHTRCILVFQDTVENLLASIHKKNSFTE